MQIDHVIYATGDLDAAAARLEAELGLRAESGGRHEGLGTHNLIVPLANGTYIELLAVADPGEAASSPVGAALQARIESGEGLIAWAVGVADVEPIAERLGTPVSGIAREGLSARLTGIAEALAEPSLPFFIERPDGPAAAPSGADGIAWIEVAGDAARLETWLGGAALPVRVVGGAPAVRAIGLGDRELRTG